MEMLCRLRAISEMPADGRTDDTLITMLGFPPRGSLSASVLCYCVMIVSQCRYAFVDNTVSRAALI